MFAKCFRLVCYFVNIHEISDHKFKWYTKYNPPKSISQDKLKIQQNVYRRIYVGIQFSINLKIVVSALTLII